MLQKLPVFAARTVPGIFLGYSLLSGGRWHGEYLVALLSDYEDGGNASSVRVHRVREIHFDPSDVVFPLRAARGKLRCTVELSGYDKPLVHTTDADDEPAEEAELPREGPPPDAK